MYPVSVTSLSAAWEWTDILCLVFMYSSLSFETTGSLSTFPCQISYKRLLLNYISEKSYLSLLFFFLFLSLSHTLEEMGQCKLALFLFDLVLAYLGRETEFTPQYRGKVAIMCELEVCFYPKTVCGAKERVDLCPTHVWWCSMFQCSPFPGVVLAGHFER